MKLHIGGGNRFIEGFTTLMKTATRKSIELDQPTICPSTGLFVDQNGTGQTYRLSIIV